MSRPIEDLTGQKFGRLTVRELHGSEGGHASWTCDCECGKETQVRGTRLRSGRIVSCGCWRADPAVRRAAMLRVPAKRRKQIAQLGKAARRNP